MAGSGERTTKGSRAVAVAVATAIAGVGLWAGDLLVRPACPNNTSRFIDLAPVSLGLSGVVLLCMLGAIAVGRGADEHQRLRRAVIAALAGFAALFALFGATSLYGDIRYPKNGCSSFEPNLSLGLSTFESRSGLALNDRGIEPGRTGEPGSPRAGAG